MAGGTGTPSVREDRLSDDIESGPTDVDEESVIYGVRFSREAEQNAIDIAHALARQSYDGEAIALYTRLYDESQKLALLPSHRAVDAEVSAQLGYPVRRLPIGGYRLAYRIETDADGPVVVVLCIRGAVH